MVNVVHVIGGGLAGSEAAWQIAAAGVPVVLHEMRPVRGTEAHLTDGLAELVCSNSFRSDDAANNAVGLLHEEMRRAGSLIMRAADAHKLPAGGALAVDRHGFSAAVQQALLAHPLVDLRREEVAGLPPAEWDSVIVATGPLTSPALADAIRRHSGEEALAFFDAIAPIVHIESIDRSIAWKQSRYDKGGPAGDGADYFNCPLDKAQYEAFAAGLLAGDKAEFKEWEASTPYFDGCLPIEVMAARGPDTLRWGPMKPVGLRDPRTGRRPWAVVQLRQDNALATLWNIVGFQTKLRHGCSAPSRASSGRSSRGWVACTATPSSTARACSTARFGSGPCRGCASPARSRAARAMSKAPQSDSWRAASPLPIASASHSPSRRPPRPWAHCWAISPAGPTLRPSSR